MKVVALGALAVGAVAEATRSRGQLVVDNISIAKEVNFFFVEKNNIFLTLIILLDRCHFPHCSGSRVPRVQKFIRDLATGTYHPIKMT